jgi:phage N-6-adenine-methyltransferase
MNTAVSLQHKIDQLPDMVTRAGTRLIEARSSAEVLEAKQMAELALHYAKVTRAANDTHADCLRIITRAEIRMANEVDRGRETGEVAKKNEPVTQYVRTSDVPKPSPHPVEAPVPATLADLGITRQRLSEWRQVRDAGEEVVEAAIQTAIAEDRAPTKNDILTHVRGTFGTGQNEWYTPEQYIACARAVLGQIDLDPASSDFANRTVRATKFFTLEDNGLAQAWGGRVWLNPPYAQPAIADFVKRLVKQVLLGNVSEAIMLTHNYTDTAWFHEAMSAVSAVCFTRGRIGFLSPEGAKAAPTQGQAFFYYGDHVKRFAEEFSSIGFIVVPHGV